MFKFGVFIAVVIAHLLALQTYIAKKEAVTKPKAKVYRITLSSVVVKKPVPIPPKPKVEPIILPPDPEPEVQKPEPIILPPDPEPVVKPKRVKKKIKKRKKKKVVKPQPKPEPIIEPEPIVEEVVPEPIVEQVKEVVQTVDTSSLKDAYTSEIRRQINQHLFYPRMAKRLRMQGVVEVAFRVLSDGSITNIQILNAPKKLLGKGAIKTLKMLNLRPIPNALGESFLDITIPIEFRLIRR